MNPQTNRRLHALAGRISKTHAHDILKETAFQVYGKTSLGDVTETEARDIAKQLTAAVEEARKKAFTKTNGVPPITEAQLGYARRLQKHLAWSGEYLNTMIAQRYQEEGLESMPEWKAVRLIAEMRKRWMSKKKQAVHNQPLTHTHTHTQGDAHGRQENSPSH